MARPSVTYRCVKCDAQFPKWEGRCRECGAWGTIQQAARLEVPASSVRAAVVDFSALDVVPAGRTTTGFAEFDRVLGGGLVPGALVLIGGDPGIGKSTLLLQVAQHAATTADDAARSDERPTLYVSGEESAEQVKLRLDRLGLPAQGLRFLGSPTVEDVAAAVDEHRPRLVILDSLQTVRSADSPAALGAAGLRQATEQLAALARQSATPILLVGHVTKQGGVAGPKAVEHFVDAVLYLEGTEGRPYRVLRATKNRFGGMAEVGVWRMTDRGLVEVPNPSATFIADRLTDVPGTTVTALVQGSRVFLVEVQALVSKTRFGYPQRRASGFDLNRLQLLIAVLTKRLGLPLPYYDVHLNVAGGLRAAEPSVDLPVSLAVVSALRNAPLPADLVAVGEVGLQGEVRSVGDLERRLAEAARLGFHQAIVPKQELPGQLPITSHVATTLPEAVGWAWPS